MKLIEKDDLEADPGEFPRPPFISSRHSVIGSLTLCPDVIIAVVRFQHKYFVPIAVFSGLVLPTLVAKYGWNDAMGGYVWGGLVARLLIWSVLVSFQIESV